MVLCVVLWVMLCDMILTLLLTLFPSLTLIDEDNCRRALLCTSFSMDRAAEMLTMNDGVVTEDEVQKARGGDDGGGGGDGGNGEKEVKEEGGEGDAAALAPAPPSHMPAPRSVLAVPGRSHGVGCHPLGKWFILYIIYYNG